MSSNTAVGASSASFEAFKTFIVVIIFGMAAIYMMTPVLIPIIISFTLYALFEPATIYLVRHNINHSLSILIVLVLLVFFSFIAIGFALPQLIEQASLLQAKLPQILSKLEVFVSDYSQQISELVGAEFNASDIIMSTLSESSSLAQSLLLNLSNKLLNIIIFMLLVPFLTYYLLKDFRSVRNRLMNWLPNSSFELGWIIYRRVSNQLLAYTRGVMMQSMIMATVSAIGFSLIGLDIPVLLGALTGLLNLVPYVGPVISILLSLLVASAMTPFDPSLLYLSVLVIITAQIVDNVIVIPSLIANAVNLHPVEVIVGIIIIGTAFGTVGVILAIPALATAKIIFSNLYTDYDNAATKMSFKQSANA